MCTTCRILFHGLRWSKLSRPRSRGGWQPWFFGDGGGRGEVSQPCRRWRRGKEVQGQSTWLRHPSSQGSWSKWTQPRAAKTQEEQRRVSLDDDDARFKTTAPLKVSVFRFGDCVATSRRRFAQTPFLFSLSSFFLFFSLVICQSLVFWVFVFLLKVNATLVTWIALSCVSSLVDQY